MFQAIRKHTTNQINLETRFAGAKCFKDHFLKSAYHLAWISF